MSKYGAKKVKIDGITFDSKIEGEYYLYLKQSKLRGEIKSFELQPTFTLQPKFEKDGVKYQAIKYVADFRVDLNDGTSEVIDIKGMKVPVFSIKEKMFHYNFKDKLKLLTYSKLDGGWVELDVLTEGRKERSVNKAEIKRLNEIEQKKKESMYMKGEELHVIRRIIVQLDLTVKSKDLLLKYIHTSFSSIETLMKTSDLDIKKNYLKRVNLVREKLKYT